MCRVYLLYEHRLFANGLEQLLRQGGVKVVGVAANSKDALADIRKTRPDVIIAEFGEEDREVEALLSRLIKMAGQARIVRVSLEDRTAVCYTGRRCRLNTDDELLTCLATLMAQDDRMDLSACPSLEKGRRHPAKRAVMRKVSVIAGLVFTLSWLGVVSADMGNAAKGKEIYGKLCASCHGMAGKGHGAAAAALKPKPKDLSDKAYTSKLEDQFLSDIIGKGGTSVGKSALMPPFGGSLKDQDVRDLIGFLRSLGK